MEKAAKALQWFAENATPEQRAEAAELKGFEKILYIVMEWRIYSAVSAEKYVC